MPGTTPSEGLTPGRTVSELRRALAEARRAWSSRAWLGTAVFAAALLLPMVLPRDVAVDRLAHYAYLAAAAVALGLLVGPGGMPSLCQGVFVGLGAVISARLGSVPLLVVARMCDGRRRPRRGGRRSHVRAIARRLPRRRDVADRLGVRARAPGVAADRGRRRGSRRRSGPHRRRRPDSDGALRARRRPRARRGARHRLGATERARPPARRGWRDPGRSRGARRPARRRAAPGRSRSPQPSPGSQARSPSTSRSSPTRPPTARFSPSSCSSPAWSEALRARSGRWSASRSSV